MVGSFIKINENEKEKKKYKRREEVWGTTLMLW